MRSVDGGEYARSIYGPEVGRDSDSDGLAILTANEPGDAVGPGIDSPRLKRYGDSDDAVRGDCSNGLLYPPKIQLTPLTTRSYKHKRGDDP